MIAVLYISRLQKDIENVIDWMTENSIKFSRYNSLYIRIELDTSEDLVAFKLRFG